MANPIKKCVLHGAVNNETVDLYPRTNLASVSDMTAFARTLNGAADAAAARNTLEITTQAALINIIYPVGSVITLTSDTDPNAIYSGTTWVKMDAGRVLVSAGTYTEDGETYTYALGDKGGEAKHPLTTKELAPHGHSISVTTTGLTGYIAVKGEEHSSSGIVSSGASNIGNARGIDGNGSSFTINASHNHSATASNAGGGASHENRQPYEVVYQWKRTV